MPQLQDASVGQSYSPSALPDALYRLVPARSMVSEVVPHDWPVIGAMPPGGLEFSVGKDVFRGGDVKADSAGVELSGLADRLVQFSQCALELVSPSLGEVVFLLVQQPVGESILAGGVRQCSLLAQM